jgi:hypothetical protein
MLKSNASHPAMEGSAEAMARRSCCKLSAEKDPAVRRLWLRLSMVAFAALKAVLSQERGLGVKVKTEGEIVSPFLATRALPSVIVHTPGSPNTYLSAASGVDVPM